MERAIEQCEAGGAPTTAAWLRAQLLSTADRADPPTSLTLQADAIAELAHAVVHDLTLTRSAASLAAESAAAPAGSAFAVGAPTAATQPHIDEKPAGASVSNAASIFSKEPVLLALKDVSCSQPRGKFTLEFRDDSLTLRATSATGATVVIPRRSINGLFYVPVRDRSRSLKPGADAAAEFGACQHWVVINLANPVTVGKSPCSVVGIIEQGAASAKAGPVHVTLEHVWARDRILNAAAARELAPDADASAPLPSGTELHAPNSVMLLTRVLSCWIGTIGTLDPALFVSANRDGYVKCYNKTSDGLLFPLRRAFVFGPRPLLCIPHTSIQSAAVGRTGGSVTRTFDFELTLQSGGKVAFSMIDNAELDVLRAYVSTRAFGGARPEAVSSAENAPAPSAAASTAAPENAAPAQSAAAVPAAPQEDNMNDAASIASGSTGRQDVDDDPADSDFTSDASLDADDEEYAVGRAGAATPGSTDADSDVEEASASRAAGKRRSMEPDDGDATDAELEDGSGEDADEPALSDADSLVSCASVSDDELQALMEEAGGDAAPETATTRKRRRAVVVVE